MIWFLVMFACLGGIWALNAKPKRICRTEIIFVKDIEDNNMAGLIYPASLSNTKARR